ncbi:hypothetical protein [Clostridium beijerinckii]|uniref:hypothetical protein n=1 Tax=Clostridium beijerinckii TaxID=1520 RepID=UPI00080A049E|nr:hypothetical protein [Clostridium beijerinckii]OCA97872.1 hypothetical protein BGS1_02270 [Clostridium beijerinckii]
MNDNEISRMIEETDFLEMLKDNKLKKRNPATLYLDEETEEELDWVTNILNRNTEESISKSLIVEVATKEFINKFRASESMGRFINGVTSIDHLVIIFTSKNDNNLYFERFHGITASGNVIEKRWSSITLGAETIRLINTGVIRFISIYRGKPLQACEEYGEIDRIELIDANNLAKDDPTENVADIGKYRIFIKGSIRRLPHEIKLGEAVPSALMRGKKTTLRKMFTETSIDKL